MFAANIPILVTYSKTDCMPVNKSAFLRYRIIDKCLTNPMHRFPGMSYIIEKITEQLGVQISSSMFSKDIREMKDIYNAPIEFNRLHNGYCYTQDGFSIKEFPLTHEEIDALDFSTALLQQLKGTRMFYHFESAINKVIEGYRLSNIIGKSETQLLQVEEPVRCDSGKWLEVILRSIVETKCLEVVYQPFGKMEKTHRLSPYLLKEYRNRWYMVGFSSVSETVLVMALDRIRSIKDCDSPYTSDASFIPADFFRYSLGITQLHGTNPEKVKLSFSSHQAPYILSQPLHASQELLSETEDGIVIQLTVYPTAELRMAILSYASDVEVLEPASLRREISQAIEEMNKIYKGVA